MTTVGLPLTMMLCGWLLLSLTGSPALAQDDATPQWAYMDLAPPFVVSIGTGPQVDYLKTEVTLRVRAESQEQIQHHMPALRHALIMLLSRQPPATLISSGDHEVLRQQALAAVRAVLEPEGEADTIRDLLFTGFVSQVQRR